MDVVDARFTVVVGFESVGLFTSVCLIVDEIGGVVDGNL